MVDNLKCICKKHRNHPHCHGDCICNDGDKRQW